MEAKRKILVSKLPWEIRVAVIEGKLVEYHWGEEEEEISHNAICVGVVEKIIPGLQTAFVSLPNGETGYLFVSEIPYGRNKRIENLLREGQKVIVQVIRERIEGKKARVSMKIKIPGIFLVGIPFVKGVKISHRIDSDEIRRRMKLVLKDFTSKMGFIVRTAAVLAPEEVIEEEARNIMERWREMNLAVVPKVLYTEPPLYIRIIREFMGRGIDEVIVDSPEIYEEINRFLLSLPIKFNLNLRFYNSEIPLFHVYGVKSELERALRKKVWLKNGGYILIEEMEGFTGIDVNTGRFMGIANFEESAFITNCLAAEEIARQVRLRNIGGIIVIDFIDMESKEKKDELIEILRRELEKDRARISLPERVEKFGIVSFTREKDDASFSRKITVSCPICGGKGGVFSSDFIIKEALEELIRHPMLKSGHKTCITAIIKLNSKEEIRPEEFQPFIESIKKYYNLNILLEPAELKDKRYEIVWKEGVSGQLWGTCEEGGEKS